MLQYGIDQLLKSAEFSLPKNNWGLVTNDAAQTWGSIPSRIALLKAGWQLNCLFSPEHGLSAAAQDGQAQDHQQDPLTELPVYSLYGPAFGPTLQKLEALAGILFDLPDAGVRFYTYVWTLSHVMEACMEAGKPLIILDRPNPLSGQLELAEGPMLDETNLSSFIGRWRMPIRHSLTFGELARYWQAERRMQQLNLTVIPCRSWRRSQYLADTGLPFVPPSPALNHPETLLTYPALCFMEGMNLNEGRGTPLPFQQFGAPWLEAEQLAVILNGFGFEGARFEPVRFRPQASRYAGEMCEGVRLYVEDRSVYRPVRTGIAIMALLNLHYRDSVKWTRYPTHANPSGIRHLELLLGDSLLFSLMEEHPQKILERLPAITAVADWENEVSLFLLYAETGVSGDS